MGRPGSVWTCLARQGRDRAGGMARQEAKLGEATARVGRAQTARDKGRDRGRDRRARHALCPTCLARQWRAGQGEAGDERDMARQGRQQETCPDRQRGTRSETGWRETGRDRSRDSAIPICFAPCLAKSNHMYLSVGACQSLSGGACQSVSGGA
jgi:hypothetical protein